MWTIAIAAVCLAVASASPVKTHLHVVSRLEQVAAEINAKETTWKAGVNSRFVNASEQFIRRQMGTFLEGSPITLDVADIKVSANLPTSFDSRQQWGNMCVSVNEVRDQANCGSCWAFGAVEAMTDRICIKSNGAQTPHISAQDLLTCCGFSCGNGCDGGYLQGAWAHFRSDGIVTGGNYNTHQGCSPYSLANCDHHVSGKYGPCPAEVGTPACKRTCETGYNNTYNADKHFGASAYSVPSQPDAIATEIMTNGPVEAAFTVYEDFLAYKTGVYQHTSGQALGGHAIKIIGWGVDSGVDYWIVANSWNEDWGDNGFFKIRKGNDECGIESQVTAGEPKL